MYQELEIMDIWKCSDCGEVTEGNGFPKGWERLFSTVYCPLCLKVIEGEDRIDEEAEAIVHERLKRRREKKNG